jgi:hypothetical protein
MVDMSGQRHEEGFPLEAIAENQTETVPGQDNLDVIARRLSRGMVMGMGISARAR